MFAITYLQQTPRRPVTPSMRRAHRLVAKTFLHTSETDSKSATPVAGWKAWLFAGWVVVAVATYLIVVLGAM